MYFKMFYITERILRKLMSDSTHNHLLKRGRTLLLFVSGFKNSENTTHQILITTPANSFVCILYRKSDHAAFMNNYPQKNLIYFGYDIVICYI